MLEFISSLSKVVLSIFERVIPDKQKQEQAKLLFLEQQQSGELKDLELQMSAIVAEAKSADPWTSRARPSFLYVMYIMILLSVPMGFLSWLNPIAAHAIILGMKEWLAAIPNGLWTVFGMGYLGYSVAKSYDKKQLIRMNE